MSSLFGKLFGRSPAVPTPDKPTSDQPAPREFETLYAAATAAATAQDFERAVPLYTSAIAASPDTAEPYYKRANALKNLGQLAAAVASYDQAIARKPDYAYAYCNRGVVQLALGSPAAALASLDRAIALEPNDAFAHYNRALVLQDGYRWDEAVASYDRAIALNPGFSDAHYNRSLTLLFTGDYARGWAGFEWRWQNAQRLAIGAPRNFQQPLWLGTESIAGRRLLLYPEGGFGDTLQFCRYAALAAARGATVILEVQPPLVRLLSTLEGVSQVIATGSPLPEFDYQCPLMSLPLALNTTLATIPAPSAYLHADGALVAKWRARLGERTRPRIGLAWSGNRTQTIDARRSVQLADLLPHLPPGFDYFCLQKEIRPVDQPVLEANKAIFSHPEELGDFADTAALCACMDVVLSTDTAPAHLSGALGQRTWVMLSFVPDWRWLLDREDCPWYSSLKLYRQKAPGEWSELFARVAADLQREFAGG